MGGGGASVQIELVQLQRCLVYVKAASIRVSGLVCGGGIMVQCNRVGESERAQGAPMNGRAWGHQWWEGEVFFWGGSAAHQSTSLCDPSFPHVLRPYMHPARGSLARARGHQGGPDIEARL